MEKCWLLLFGCSFDWLSRMFFSFRLKCVMCLVLCSGWCIVWSRIMCVEVSRFLFWMLIIGFRFSVFFVVCLGSLLLFF